MDYGKLLNISASLQDVENVVSIVENKINKEIENLELKTSISLNDLNDSVSPLQETVDELNEKAIKIDDYNEVNITHPVYEEIKGELLCHLTKDDDKIIQDHSDWGSEFADHVRSSNLYIATDMGNTGLYFPEDGEFTGFVSGEEIGGVYDTSDKSTIVGCFQSNFDYWVVETESELTGLTPSKNLYHFTGTYDQISDKTPFKLKQDGSLYLMNVGNYDGDESTTYKSESLQSVLNDLKNQIDEIPESDIIKEVTVSDDLKITLGNDDGSEIYVEMSSSGIKAKAYFDENGDPLNFGNSEFKDKIYVSSGDSLTEGAGLHRQDDLIDVNDSAYPLAGAAKKTYAYYIAKNNKLKWINLGIGGTTLGDISANGIDRVGFSKENGRYTTMPSNVDLISIWFGWNDDYYGPIMKREDWLLDTYGSKIYYPLNNNLIGTTHTDGTPYTTQEQYDACNAVTGTVNGITYNTSNEYFAALYRGTSSDTTNKTFWGAYNIVLPYLIEKYPFAKILIITGYGGDSLIWDISVAAAKKFGVSYIDLSLPETNFINVRNSSTESNGLVYYDATKYTDTDTYSTFTSGNIPVKTFKIRTLLYDTCHPNYRGYQYIYNKIQNKLLTI